MVSEIFSTSFLVSIAVCLILVGGLFAYFNYRFSEQNHKMQSMLGLVSTMAEEMQYFRSKLTNKSVEQNDTSDEANSNSNVQIIPNFLGGNANSQMSLIEVSDSEEEEEDEEDNEDNEEEEEDDEHNEEEEEEDEDNEDDNEDNNSVEDLNDELSELEELDDDDEDTNKKVISIDLGTNNNDLVIESEDINLDTNDTNDKNVKHINIDFASDNDNDNDDLNLENMEMSLKSISIDESVSSKGKEDYKKMSLNKLRDVVCAKGLVVDASKLKKNELLKLLGDE
jgi:hypothetical protein